MITEPAIVKFGFTWHARRVDNLTHSALMRVDSSTSRERVEIGLGVTGPLAVDVRALASRLYSEGESGLPPGDPSEWGELEGFPWGPYDLRLTLYWSGDRYTLSRLEMHDFYSFFDSGGVSTAGLRHVRLGRALYDAARAMIESGALSVPEDAADPADARVLRSVRIAQAVGANVQDFVAERLGVSRSTAKRMVALARNARGDG